MSEVTTTNMLVSLVLIPQTEMARYHQGGEVSVFNQTQSHHQLQRMLPEGAHSLGKPRTVCLFVYIDGSHQFYRATSH